MTHIEFRQAREDLGWTQSALASALGVTPRAVRYYESGQRRVPVPISRLLQTVVEVSASV